MKSKMVWLAVIIMTLVIGAGCSSTTDTFKAEIDAVLNEYQAAMIDEDADTMVSMYSDPFTLVSAGGISTSTNLNDFKVMVNHTFSVATILDFKFSNRNIVKVDENTAIVSSDNYQKLKVGSTSTSKEIEITIKLEHTLVKSNEAWKITTEKIITTGQE